MKILTPKPRRTRGRIRTRSEGRVSNGSPSPVRLIGDKSGIESDSEDELDFGSSFTNSESGVSSFNVGGNVTKKLKLDDEARRVEESVIEKLGEGIEDSDGSVEMSGDSEDQKIDSDMVTGKEGDSSRDEELSSEVDWNALPPGTSGMGGMGGV